jgi:hypothetical protein
VAFYFAELAMNFTDIEQMCKRAALFTLQKKKLLFSALILFFSGLVLLFGMGLGLGSGPWMSQSLFFVPLFIALGTSMALGVILIRSYHDEVKQKEGTLVALIKSSVPSILGIAMLFAPIILGYLCLWVSMGIYLLCSEIPYIGTIFATVFAFVPFVMNVAIVLGVLFSIYLLFALTPTFALTNVWQGSQFVAMFEKALKGTTVRLSLFAIAFLPLSLLSGLLFFASFMTMQLIGHDVGQLQLVIECFFIMLPLVLFLAPGVIFFFNMSAEAHIFLQKS